MAVKCVKMWDSSELEELQAEFQIMEYCMDHPHIVKLQGVYHDQKKGQLQIVMDLMHGECSCMDGAADGACKCSCNTEKHARGFLATTQCCTGH